MSQQQARRGSESATGKRLKTESAIFSAVNTCQPKLSRKKIWLAGSQPKKCVSWSLALKKFGSGV